MTESEIQELEAVNGGPLPAVYRELLLNYPQQLTDLATTLGIEELELLFHTRESLIRVNGEQPEYFRSIFLLIVFSSAKMGVETCTRSIPGPLPLPSIWADHISANIPRM